MKNRFVEVKLPIDIVKKVEKAKKNGGTYAKLPFSEYLNVLIIKALDQEAGRISDFHETVRMSRRKVGGERKILAFAKKK